MKRDDIPSLQPELLKPWHIVHPHTAHWQKMMTSPSARAASAADLAPPPPRAGSEDFLNLPSRMSHTLRYRDGCVTDLQGNLLEYSR